MDEPRIHGIHAKRHQHQTEVFEMGINDAFVDELVETFYGRIREDEVLGPVFNDAIGDNWPEHLSRMKDFWASVAYNAARYSGRPVPAHKKHSSIKEEHFERWLGIFRKTLEDIAPSEQVVDYFMW